MGRQLGEARAHTTISLSVELHSLARENGISLSEAVRVGVGIMLAEKGVKDYDSNLNISRRIVEREDKIRQLVSKLEATSQELASLKDRL
jgi:hypothetical protein